MYKRGVLCVNISDYLLWPSIGVAITAKFTVSINLIWLNASSCAPFFLLSRDDTERREVVVEGGGSGGPSSEKKIFREGRNNKAENSSLVRVMLLAPVPLD